MMIERNEQLRMRMHRDYPRGVPRGNMVKGSPEWCYMTMDYAKSLYNSHQVSLEAWNNILAEMEEVKIFECVPEWKSYGSLDALLKAELGVDKEESRAKLGQHGGDRRSEDYANQGSDRTLIRGEGVDYLRARLERDHPELLERLDAGEFTSVRAAAIEAGFVKPRLSLPVDNVDSAIRILVSGFDPDLLGELGERLVAVAAALGPGTSPKDLPRSTPKPVQTSRNGSSTRRLVTPEERTEILTRRERGETFAVIAAATGRPIATVQSIVSKAR